MPFQQQRIFEKLLEMISFESFALFVLEKLKALSNASNSISASSCKIANSSGGNTFCKASDIEILTALIGRKHTSSILSESSEMVYALSFIIRFRATQLMKFQLADVYGLKTIPCNLNLLEKKFLQEMASELQNYLIQFSTLGIYFIPQHTIEQCHYVGLYDNNRCAQKSLAGSNYCENHQTEVWWEAREPKSEIATMFQFYSELSNMECWKEADLDEMIGGFWARYSQITPYSKSELALAKRHFQIADSTQKLSKKDLKEIYVVLAIKAHPDTSGSKDDFQELQRNYEILKDHYA